MDFTRTEYRDLARGCRALARQAEEDAKKHKGTSAEPGFEKARQHHLEMATRCEELAKRAPPD